jgi:hypothetical protein
MKLPLCSFLEPPITSSLFSPNILLNTLSLCSSLNVRDQVPHPYRTTGRIIVLYILIFTIIIIIIYLFVVYLTTLPVVQIIQRQML